MNYGFVKIGTFTPEIKVLDVDFNKNNVLDGIEIASKKGVEILAFPELCLTGSTAGDLVYSTTILEKTKNAIEEILEKTSKTEMLIFIGVPLLVNSKIFNVVAVINKGKILAFIPKESVKNSKFDFVKDSLYVDYNGDKVPLTSSIIFTNEYNPKIRVSVEVGEDLFSAISPSTYHAIKGANIIVNASSFTYTFESKERIINAVKNQSEKTKTCYILCNSGVGESTGDNVYSGLNIISENGNLLDTSTPFVSGLTTSIIDIDLLDKNKCEGECEKEYLMVKYSAKLNEELVRVYDKYPFIPKGENDFAVMDDILEIQAEGLKKRFFHTWSKKLIIGLSGGLDSTLALLVAVKTIKKLKGNLKDIIAITMPCFGTTSRTFDNSIKLAKAMGVTLRKIDISKSVTRHLKDIGHSGSKYDAAFENAQARERTKVLMDVANMENGIVVGTGDMSELALGWATYNGDHMSMYGVNAGVPKTLVKYLVKVYAENSKPKLKAVLLDILGTPVSPELIPSENKEITQKTEDLVGPYALHDFYLYHLIYKGLQPIKVYAMAKETFIDEFDEKTIKKWLETFIKRFFTQQFKRSCLPDGVAVFDFSLSPRNGFKMPSDALSTVYLEQLQKV